MPIRGKREWKKSGKRPANMKTAIYSAQNAKELLEELKKHSVKDSDKLLIQIFDGSGGVDEFTFISKTIHDVFPKATTIGATTTGEISNGKILDKSIVASFSLFEETELITVFNENCDENTGISIGRMLNSEDIKVAIMFSDGLNSRPEEFISAISVEAPALTIGGGAAADNYNFQETAISINGNVYTKGIVVVALKNKNLLVKNSWRLDWKAVGKYMQITKALGNTVYEIDSQPILKVVEKYFGQKAVKGLPFSIVGFPLIKSEKDVDIARAPVGVADGGIVFAGNLHEGDFVRFGMADIESIGLCNEDGYLFAPESIWVYSCGGRKAFAKSTLEKEFGLYSRLAPSAGFFTYGEFFKTKNSTNMLNLTTTALAIAEKYIELNNADSCVDAEDARESEISTIAHLTNAIVGELEQNLKALDTYKIALDANSIVSKTDRRGVITYVNDLFVRVSGYSREELIGKPHNIVRHPDMDSKTFKEMWKTISSGKIWKGIVKNKKKNGGAYYVDTSIVPLFDEKGNITEYIASRTDLSKIIEQQKTIEKQATDKLTGLPNRVKFFEDFENIEEPVAALINVDEFGNINRFYGFEAGNQILSSLAADIRSFCLLKNYSTYKFDADNFLILGADTNEEAFADDMTELEEKLTNISFLPNSLDLKLRFTIGIASAKNQLLSKTEEALKKARTRRVNIAILSEEDEKNKRQSFEMLQVLEYAIHNDGVIPYYQPIVDVTTGKVIKYESLMRIKDKNGKIYSPFFFLDIAKKSKYYHALTNLMISKTLHDFENRTEGVSINLSMMDVENDDSVRRIKEAILEFKEPQRITFEITESESSEDYEKIIAFINDIKSLGVKISIDDFGSGYSNFAYLIRFNADYLKIDGSIIKNIATNPDSFKMASVIIDFANKLGMKTVSEFISSEEIANKAKELNSDLGQGYYYSEPKPIEEI